MQVNEDIQSSIPLLSETGPIAIPVSCLIKRALLTVEPQVSSTSTHMDHTNSCYCWYASCLNRTSYRELIRSVRI